MATLAFISEYNPSSASEKPLLDALESLMKREPTVKEKAGFRRLFHEAYALATNEMKNMVEKGEETSTRKLSQPERHDRYVRQVEKLKGVTIKGITEPSDGLVDICCSIFDDNRLRWVDWSKCTSKEQELAGDKKEHTFTVSNGTIKVDSKPQEIQANTATDVLVMQYALMRRALAFDQANLIEFTKFMKWSDRLMKARWTSLVTFHQGSLQTGVGWHFGEPSDTGCGRLRYWSMEEGFLCERVPSTGLQTHALH